MADFEAKTGIKVNYIQQPVATQDQKIPLQLAAKDTSLDVSSPALRTSELHWLQGVEQLDPYIQDTAQPGELELLRYCSSRRVGLPERRQDLLHRLAHGRRAPVLQQEDVRDASITSMPKTPDELLADAKKLTTPDHAASACAATSPGLYDAFQLWQWFYPWDNQVTAPTLTKLELHPGTEPNASKLGAGIASCCRRGAESIATYLVTNCLQDFQQGRVAMGRMTADILKS